jgi:hypothetical protein
VALAPLPRLTRLAELSWAVKMGPMLAATVLLGATLLGGGHLQASQASDYVAHFSAALAALERGELETAAAGFRAAGALAPAAPVWRASLGVTLARLDRVAEARTELELALAAGYPPSDLAALHPVGAEVVAATHAPELERREPRGQDFVRAGFSEVNEGTAREPRHPYVSGLSLGIPAATDGMTSTATAQYLQALVAARADGTESAPSATTVRLEPVDDVSIVARVRAHLGDALDERVGVLRLDFGAGDPRSVLLALASPPIAPDEYEVDFAPLHVLTHDGAEVLHRVGLGGVLDESMIGASFGLSYGVPIVAPAVDGHHATFILSMGLSSAIVAYDTATWKVRWWTPWVSGVGAPREVAAAGTRLLMVSSPFAHHLEVLDVVSGARVVHGEHFGLSALTATPSGAFVLGRSSTSTLVFDATRLEAEFRAVAPSPLPRRRADFPWRSADQLFTPTPLLEVMLRGSADVADSLAVIACDGVFDLPLAAFDGAYVYLAESAVSAASVAPWLHDPLHLRTLLLDTDLRLRGVPKLVEGRRAPAAYPVGMTPTLELADYPRQLLAALALLDSGEYHAAAEAFERAGSCAPHAPVWRVHAGLARALANERDVALAHFIAALEAGYPRDDLEAIAAWLAIDRPAAVTPVADVAELVREAAARAVVPDDAARLHWCQVTGAGHAAVPFSAEARDHGELLELAYEGRARRVADTVGEWRDSGAPLARHEFLDPKSLAVVARIAPPRPAGLGYQLGPSGAGTPVPDPRPIWVGAKDEYLDQRRYRELVNKQDAPDLEFLPRGLRTGVWLAVTRSVIAVVGERDRPHATVWLEHPSEHWTTAGIDVAHWRLLWFDPERDSFGPDLQSEVRSGALAGPDAPALATRVSELGLRSLNQVANDGLLLGLGADSVAVLDPITLAPLASLWLHDETPVVVAEDGTFTMDAAAVERALVSVGDVRVPARVVAPWLLDPLHLRTLAHDELRAARTFPVR